MRQVAEAREVTEAIQAARREAAAAFGDGTLYVEKLVTTPHHVEVQVFADDHGSTIHLFERECSVQRRHQKVIEESPSPLLTPELRERMTAAAVAAARAAAYRNAGTIEFLVDGTTGAFYFLEMNTRLQVEHPVTEQVTGLDLVRAQLLVAAGAPLPWAQRGVAQRGHAIEARVYAEDPAHGFIPQAGMLQRYKEPRWPGVRVDSGVSEGGEITVYYDPMIAKVIATAESRPLAVTRLVAALRQFEIDGVKTNLPLLIRILELDEFRTGIIDTAFLDRESARLVQSLPEVRRAESRDHHSPSDPQSPSHQSPLHQSPIPNPQSPSALPSSAWDPWTGAVVEQATAATSVRRPRRTSGSGGAITAPMPATVVKVVVKPGDAVHKGDVVVLLEAMKMELPLRADADATVAAVHCREGELVQGEAVLVEFR
jgi:acetyl/propionyl-CoA carboxylase alpha subunit